jgi:hypothetical protein
MSWMLIVFMVWYQPGPAEIPMSDEATCRAALADVLRKHPRGVLAQCVRLDQGGEETWG